MAVLELLTVLLSASSHCTTVKRGRWVVTFKLALRTGERYPDPMTLTVPALGTIEFTTGAVVNIDSRVDSFRDKCD